MNTVNVVNIFIVGFSLFATCWANSNLQTKYKWNLIDFKYEKPEDRQNYIANRKFIQTNVIPVSLDVYTEKNKLFVSLPRLKNGVPASLAYIDLNGKFVTNEFILIINHKWNYRAVIDEWFVVPCFSALFSPRGSVGCPIVINIQLSNSLFPPWD